MDQNGVAQLKGRLVARKALESHEGAEWSGKPQGQGPHRLVREELGTREGRTGREGDEQSEENWVTEGTERS